MVTDSVCENTGTYNNSSLKPRVDLIRFARILLILARFAGS